MKKLPHKTLFSTFLTLFFGLTSTLYTNAQTVLKPGDIAIIGYDTQLGTSCGSQYSTDDVIGFVTFVDIVNGTKIIFTDKAYISSAGAVSTFRNSEAAGEYTRTGGTITKGSTFYIAFGDSPGICGVGNSSCSNGWSAAMAPGSVAALSNLDMNASNGDQVFIMQGSWSSDTQFTGTFLYGLTTNNSWTYSSNATSSNLPPSLSCLNMRTNDFSKSVYNGTGFNASQYKSTHISNIYNASNWSSNAPTLSPASCPTNSNFRFTNFSTVTINPNLTDITICESQSSATISATGVGSWSVVSSTGSIVSPTQGISTVNGLNIGENIFRWTAANCSEIFDVIVTRVPLLDPTLTIISSAIGNAICTNAGITFTATATNLRGGIPKYSFLVDNISVQSGANSIYTTSSLANNLPTNATLSITGGFCLNTTTASSNTLNITVNPILLPSISITGSSSNICSGQSISFAGISANQGTSPKYQWFKNSSVISGANNATFITNSMVNVDEIFLRMTASGACLSQSVVSSNQQIITVNNSVVPQISISSNDVDNIICAGTEVIFAAVTTNSGGNPGYKWFKNNVLEATSATFTTNTLADNDVIRAEMVSNALCANPATVLGINSITMRVNGNPIPTVSLLGINIPICSNTNVYLLLWGKILVQAQHFTLSKWIMQLYNLEIKLHILLQILLMDKIF